MAHGTVAVLVCITIFQNHQLIMKLDSSFFQQILDITGEVKVSNEKRLTSLWAGYGTISSVKVRSKKANKDFIIKRVNPPHKCSVASIGDQRKIRSYHVEGYFYEKLVPYIFKWKDVVKCDVAEPYFIDQTHEDEEEDSETSFLFIMSDLSDSHDMYYDGSKEQVIAIIGWLASFHSIFFNHPDVTEAQTGNGKIWSEGGYWHLKTRLSELESIPSYYKALKESAYAVDKRMNDGSDLHFTLVHGDFKEANIMIGRGSKEDSFSCAAVDYQYCGRGFGAKDIVMLIVSSVSPQVLEAIGGEDGVIQLYADELKSNLKAMNEMNEEDINTITSFETLKMQYELAMVDYVRFMAG